MQLQERIIIFYLLLLKTVMRQELEGAIILKTQPRYPFFSQNTYMFNAIIYLTYLTRTTNRSLANNSN